MLLETHFNSNSFPCVFIFTSENMGIFMQGQRRWLLQKIWFDWAFPLKERTNKMSKEERPCVPVGDAFGVPLHIPLAHPWFQPQLFLITSRELRHLALLASSEFSSVWRPSLRQQVSFSWKYSLEMQKINVPVGNTQPMEAGAGW